MIKNLDMGTLSWIIPMGAMVLRRGRQRVREEDDQSRSRSDTIAGRGP